MKNKIFISIILILAIFIQINLYSQNVDPEDQAIQSGSTPSESSQNTSQTTVQEQQIDIPKKNIQLKGDFFSSLEMGLHSPNEFYRKCSRLRFEIEARFLGIQFYSQIQIAYDSLRDYATVDGKDISDFNKYFQLRETWIEYESVSNRTWFNRFGLKLGRIIYSWGKGDEYRPSDIINPQDYTNFIFTDLNERKIPIWSANFELRAHENWRFNFIYIPFQESSEIPNEKSYWANPNLLSLLAKLSLFGTPNINVSTPEKNFSNSSYAIKTYFKIFDVDFSIGYFTGYDTKPTINIISLSNAYMDYKHIKMLCFDFEFTLIGLGWRGEVSYFHKGKYFFQSFPTIFPYFSIEKKFLAAVFGFDKVDIFVKGFYLNFQFYAEFIFNYDNSNIIAKKNVFGITWDIYYEIINWKFEVGGIYGITNKELMLKPKIIWKVQNDFNLTLGIVLIFGQSGSEYSQAPVGIYYNKDFIYLEANYSF